jgi:hypothetical protein
MAMTLGQLIDLEPLFFLKMLPRVNINKLLNYLTNDHDYLVIFEDSTGLHMLYHDRESLNLALKTAVSSDRVQLHKIIDLKKNKISEWDAKILIK